MVLRARLLVAPLDPDEVISSSRACGVHAAKLTAHYRARLHAPTSHSRTQKLSGVVAGR